MSLEAEGKTKTIRSMKMDLRKQQKKTGYMFAQPIRIQPTRKLLGNEDVLDYLGNLTQEEVQEWGKDRVFADVKADGVRAVVVIDYPSKKVEIISRTGKKDVFKKFVDKHEKEIVDGIDWGKVKGDVIIDGELYFVKNGKRAPVAVSAGQARAPTDSTLRPKIEVFDILMVNQKDVRKMPLEKRKVLLDKAVDEEGGIIKEAETKKIKPEQITPTFKKVVESGEEGLVVKDPDQEYMSTKGKELRWRKVKAGDTLDLELKRIESWPRGKSFKFYKHLVMVPGNNDKFEIKADKGVVGAGMDHEYWKRRSRVWLGLYDKGILKGSGSVTVDKSLQKYYGRTTVPKTLTFPKGKRPIYELYFESMSARMMPSGQKLVGQRFNKEQADKMSDIRESYKIFKGKVKKNA